MAFIIDIQGFRGPNDKLIVKEIAILRGCSHHHFIITPPFDFKHLPTTLKRQAKWLYQNHHGLHWNGGFTKYNKVEEFLRDNIINHIVYVKGDEKLQWIKRLLNENVEVINVENINCPNFKELKRLFPSETRCLSHSKCCALQNVFLINNFVCSQNLKFS